jgi:regulator of protease activity HflC (stomatin/prohibitin superfamily)
LLAAAIKILREYERGVIFTLGRFTGVKGFFSRAGDPPPAS